MFLHCGAVVAPIRAAMEHDPIMVFLISVGNSSAVNMYITEYAIVMANFATKYIIVPLMSEIQ